MNRAGIAALSLVALVLFAPSALAQTYTITTYAGGYPPPVRPGTRAVDQPVYSPTAVAAGANGVFYVSSGPDHRIYRVERDGTVVVVAGTGTPGFSRDGGLGALAEIQYPGAIALDSKGNLFFADAGNSRVRRISPSGFINTVAGNGTSGINGPDGERATATPLSYPRGVAVDQAGNLFIATSNSIRKVTPAGLITTVALPRGPTPTAGLGSGGPFRNEAHGVAVDTAGNLYIADTSNNRYSGDGGEATAAPLNSPQKVAVDAAGNLFVAEASNNRIRKLTPRP